jgi:predicted ribosome quality control (RQC) complex YloA/Tae2 family protein
MLNATELLCLAAELRRELYGATIQKVFTPSARRLLLETRLPGKTVVLLLSVEVGETRISVIDRRAPNPTNPPGWQSVLRRELTGARLEQVETGQAGGTVMLHWKRGEDRRLLVFDSVKSAIALLNDACTTLTHSWLRDGTPVFGKKWVLPPTDGPVVVDHQLNRLSGDVREFRLARAAEAMANAHVSSTIERDADARRTKALKKLERTIEKVRLEAGRSVLAERYRREGEALSRCMHSVARGARQVTVTEYSSDGTVQPLSIELDASKSAQDNVNFRFHQYRRLLRGVTLSQQRLQTLEAQRDALLKPPVAEVAPLSSKQFEKKPGGAQRRQPFKTYQSKSGEKLLVGRGSSDNDALTFHVARPFHYWFHARGITGAHVIAVVDKNQELTQECLLDAAHLAAFHSDAKGEPRVEVSYTQVKYVTKPKGAAKGAVTYTREKTVLLRVDTDRLNRLLESGRSL